jgi:adenine-specific DNA-methyltransferase
MKKMAEQDGSSLDMVNENLEALKAIFPEAFTEGGVDFEVLRQLLGDAVDEGEEKYGLNWYGKKKARQIALMPSLGTLRPCPEESAEWDTTQNLFIEGDNLEVLKLLQKSYANKVKMIYIDPPYNTGNEFIYPDKFQDNLDTYLRYTGQKDSEGLAMSSNTESSGRFHTNWLNMMYSRIKLARNLLTSGGVMFVSIDDNELRNALFILAEIFGEENFVGQLVWKKKYIGGKHARHFVDLHEYVLVFAKNILDLPEILMERPSKELEKFSLEDEFVAERGKHYTRPLKSNLGRRDTLVYPIELPDGTSISTQWMVAQDTFRKLVEDGRIVFKQKRDGTFNVYRKFYQLDGEGKVKVPTLIEDVSNADGKVDIKKLFDVSEGREIPFENPKPVGLLKHLIGPSANQDDIVMDFFSGSCTTAHAVMELNLKEKKACKFVMVQLPEPCDENSIAFKSGYSNVADIGKERIRHAAAKIKEENPDYRGDLGYKIFKLDSSNIRAWSPDRNDLGQTLLDHMEHLVEGRSEEDVLYELLLKRGVDLTVPIEEKNITGKIVYSIGYGVLFACLDTAISREEVEDLAMGIVDWHKELEPASDTQVVFRDSAFANDIAKTNMTAILEQHGIAHVRSL